MQIERASLSLRNFHRVHYNPLLPSHRDAAHLGVELRHGAKHARRHPGPQEERLEERPPQRQVHRHQVAAPGAVGLGARAATAAPWARSTARGRAARKVGSQELGELAAPRGLPPDHSFRGSSSLAPARTAHPGLCFRPILRGAGLRPPWRRP